MTTDSNKLLERLRTYYGDDLACRTLLMDARHALEALAGEVERLKEERDAAITDRFDAAADRIKVVAAERDRLAGEVASLTLSNDLFQGAQKKEAEVNTQLTIQLHAIRTERDRLKAALKPRLNAKAIEGLQEILEAMEALGEREAPFLKTLLDWHEAARKALGDAS